MGASSQSLPRFTWSFVRKDDWYQIYQNDKGDLAEKHIIENNPKLSEAEQIDIYHYRYSSSKPIVKVYKVEYEGSSDFCSNHKNVTVFTEYIPYRLIDTRSISHEQGLYVLSQSLIGYHQLLSRLGPFTVNDTLIGFNKDGHTKVWYNSDYAQNHFQVNSVVLMSTVNPHKFDEKTTHRMELDMVWSIWSTVDRHALFRHEFRRQVQSLDGANFYNLKEIVDAEISRCKWVPSTLKFQDKFGIVSSSRAMLLEVINKRSKIFKTGPMNGNQAN